MDRRDRLIIALCALLRAERQTRDAMAAALATGSLSPEVLRAMLTDPVPVITQQDVAEAEELAKAA